MKVYRLPTTEIHYSTIPFYVKKLYNSGNDENNLL